MTATLESLKRKVDATEDLQSVVKTMKALAAVNIRQYEDAVASLEDSRRTVELALQAAVRQAHTRQKAGDRTPRKAGLILVGSDQGMCGQFNEDIAHHAVNEIQSAEPPERKWLVLAIGEKATAALEARGQRVTANRNVPGSSGAITSHVRGILAKIDEWQSEHGELSRIMLAWNRYEQQNTKPRTSRLLPLDDEWLHQLQQRPWPTNALPMFTVSAEALLSHLVRQYLFIEIHGALAESSAAENATRLRAMQSAEKNVEERLDNLTARYNRQRQNSITSELLDVISGSEAVTT